MIEYIILFILSWGTGWCLTIEFLGRYDGISSKSKLWDVFWITSLTWPAFAGIIIVELIEEKIENFTFFELNVPERYKEADKK